MPLFAPPASTLDELTDVDVAGVTDNQKLVYDSATLLWKAVTSATVTVSVTPPSAPKFGDLWFDIS